jgi:ribulose-5-phosphate 4-epimerase/fuculose-1-phosphate aldolase
VVTGTREAARPAAVPHDSASGGPVDLERDERGVRTALAAAFRWAARLGLHEGVANHFSATLPGSDDFLVNPRGAHFSEITASSLVRVDPTRRHEDPLAHGVDPTAWVLHAFVHARVPRARCIIHTHMPHATALACLEGYRFQMLDQNACRFHGRIAYDRDYAGMALDPAEGERVATLLGDDHDVLFLGNHGVFVVADSVAEAFDLTYHLERAAHLQVLALSTGRPLSIVSDEVAARACAQWRDYPEGAELHLAALMRILDRESPEYRS